MATARLIKRQRTLDRMLNGTDANGTGASIQDPAHRRLVQTYMGVRRRNDAVTVGTRIHGVTALACLSRWVCAKRQSIPLEAVSKEDLQDWAEDLEKPESLGGLGYEIATRIGYQIEVAHFYKWLEHRDSWPESKDERAKLPYPKRVSWMRLKRSQIPLKVKPEECLTRADVFRIISVTTNPRDAALAAGLWDVGGRIGMILSYNVESYEPDPFSPRLGHLTVPMDADMLKIPELVRGHRAPIIDAKPYYDAFVSHHPFSEYGTAPMFYATNHPNYPVVMRKISERRAWKERAKTAAALGRPATDAGPEPPHPTKDELETLRLGDESVRALLQRLAKRAGISKPVNPHRWRHSRVTDCRNRGMPDRQVKRRFTWSGNSRMPDHYDHAMGKDDDAAIMRVHGIDPDVEALDVEPAYAPLKCHACGYLNAPTATFCQGPTCQAALDPARFQTQATRAGKDHLKALLSDPDIAKELLEPILARLAQSSGLANPDGVGTEAGVALLEVEKARRTLEKAAGSRTAEAGEA